MHILTEASDEQTEQQACVSAFPTGWVTYKVQAGNTLSELIAGSGVSLAEVMRANCIENPNLITVGAVLYLPYSPASITPESQSNGENTGVAPGFPTSGGENGGTATNNYGNGITNGNPDGSSGESNDHSDDSGDSGGSSEDSGGHEHHGE